MKHNIFYSLYFSFGVYGFSREFRSKNLYTERFFTEKIFVSSLNGMLYLTPPYNIYFLTKLLNRLEIQSKTMDKKLHEDEYTEFFGNTCDSTW